MKNWIQAARPKTLLLAVASILMGNATAGVLGYENKLIMVLCLATAVCLQILSNFANDYGDFVKGTDALNRIGPDRQLQSGTISQKQMLLAIILMAILSLGIGVYLSFYALMGSPALVIFVGLGALAVLAAITYTVGKNAYGYKALGDIFVFVFFGLVSVLGTFYLISQSWDFRVIFPALFMGSMSVGVLNLNNMRDIQNDRLAGKQTIPSLIGLKKAKIYHTFLMFLAFVSLFLFECQLSEKHNVLLFVAMTPLLIYHLSCVYKAREREFNPLLAQLSIFTFLIVLVWYFSYLLK